MNQFINYNNKLFLVKRIFKESEVKPDFDVNVMKEWTRTDMLLKKNGTLYCCETIEDAQIIEQQDIL